MLQTFAFYFNLLFMTNIYNLEQYFCIRCININQEIHMYYFKDNTTFNLVHVQCWTLAMLTDDKFHEIVLHISETC